MPSFKVPCPSCENEVLIKSPNLVGTKVECPKCKYRFKVEEPAGGIPKEEAKPTKAKKPDGKKTDADAAKKKKTKKIVAIAAGVLAVAVLAIAAISMMGGGDNKPKGGGGGAGGSGGGFARGGGGTEGTGGTEDPDKKGGEPDKDKKEEPKKKPKTTYPESTKETSNLLPGQTVSLYRFDVQKLRGTPAGPLFDRTTEEMFRSSMGFELDEVTTYYHAFVGASRDTFGLIKLFDPMSEKDIIGGMDLAPAAQEIKGRRLYTFKSNPLITGVASAFSLASVFADFLDKATPGVSRASANRTMGVCVYDTQHVLIGDHNLLAKYLFELEGSGYPKFQSVVGDPPPGVTAAYAERPLYQTIDPKLKKLLIDLGAEEHTGPPMVVYAEKLVPGLYNPKLFKSDFQAVTEALDPLLGRAVMVGVNLTSFTAKQLIGSAEVVMVSDSAAQEVVKEQLTGKLGTLAEAMTLLLGSPVEFHNIAGGWTPGSGTGSPLLPGGLQPGGSPLLPGGLQPGGPFGGGMRPGGPPLPGGMRPGGSGLPGQPPAGGGGGGPPPGYNTMRPGGSGLPGQPPAGGGGGGPPPGYNTMRPGGGGSQPRPGGGAPAAGGEEGIGGGPGGTQPGGNIPGVGTPPPTNLPAVSHVDLGLTDQNIFITLELNWDDDAYLRTVAPRILGMANTLKGKMAVYASDISYHALALAVPKMTEATKAFPRGTAERRLTDPSRMGLKYPPQTRVSFFVELLPYLGRGNLTRMANKDLAWFDEKNLPAGEAWVPELLVPSYPQTSWRATSPFVADGRVLGGTNYVAIAGVGRDAARYDPNDPKYKAKVGITGYDWGSKVDEVTDGLEYTIYLMQTPPGMSQPWIAGGGATVRGLDVDDPMNGFRYDHGGGKVGTYALMGDGSVRWIPGDIKKDLLLAMATRAGGEAFVKERIDKEAPLVSTPKKAEAELKADPKAEPGAAGGGTPETAPDPREKK